MRILTIHSEHATHDSACCIYDGENITYFLEERFSGEKHDERLQNCFHNILKTNLTFDKIVVGGFHTSEIYNLHGHDDSLLKKVSTVLPTLAKKALGTPMFFTNVGTENLANNLDVFVKYELPEELTASENYKKIEKEWEKTSEDVRYFLLNYYKKYKQFPVIEYDSNHHFNHAAISFYNSGFDEAIVFVADGAGETAFATADTGKYLCFKESESLYVANYKDSIKPIYKNYGSYPGHNYTKLKEHMSKKMPDCEIHFGNYLSLGLLYSSAVIHIGQKSDEAGKAMGLSSYGESTGNVYVKDDYFITSDKFNIECHDFIPLFAPPNGYPENFKYRPVNAKTGTVRGGPESFILLPDLPVQKLLTKNNYKPYANLAKDIQLQTQEVAVKLIAKAIEKTGLKKVCVCGGYGMNILANTYYTEKFPDVEFYFEPLAVDSGIPIGMAMHHYRKETGDKTIRPIKDIFFHGLKYDVSQYKGVDADVKDIAKLLYDNKSVAVYRGLAEAGQRALGNRSILFNALNVNAKDIVNVIKRREWYRPFAAVVLEEDAHLYFDMGKIKRNLFMTQAFNVKTDLIPGVTHVDNTCRVQTVSEGYLYDLLLEFKKLSGHGILLNTSFNLAGKPLVETPKQAIETLRDSELNYLWFEETGQLIS